MRERCRPKTNKEQSGRQHERGRRQRQGGVEQVDGRGGGGGGGQCLTLSELNCAYGLGVAWDMMRYA